MVAVLLVSSQIVKSLVMVLNWIETRNKIEEFSALDKKLQGKHSFLKKYRRKEHRTWCNEETFFSMVAYGMVS